MPVRSPAGIACSISPSTSCVANAALKEERRRIAKTQELENKIASLEAEMADLSHKLENPPADTALVRKWGNQYNEKQREMDLLLWEWEGLQS